MDRMYLETRGSRGVSIFYEPAVKIKRGIWMSAAFVSHHPKIHQDVMNALGLPVSKWYPVSLDDFVTYHVRDQARPVKQRRPKDMIGLVTRAEKNREAIWWGLVGG